MSPLERGSHGGDPDLAWDVALTPRLRDHVLRALVAAPGPETQQRIIAGLLPRPEPVTADAVLEAIVRQRPAAREATAAQRAACAQALSASGAVVRVPGGRGYPSRLAQAWPELGAPAWLVVRAPGGALPERPTVGVVGTRRATLAGTRLARELGRGLARAGACVVSGLARGIDQAAQRGALEVEGATVGVAGCGLDVDYPRGDEALRAAVARAGGLVTELAPGTPPRPHQFLARNRIIAGLCDAVVVVEGRDRSGALHTARLAAAQGREVWAVPGHPLASAAQAPLALIRDGAQVLTAVEDLLAAVVPAPAGQRDAGMAPADDAPDPAAPSAPAQRVRERLDPVQPASLGALAEATALGLPAVAAAVGELVALGHARQTPQGVLAS